jgi:glycosyltransferase involved in cell wall biosynthesis
MDLISVIVTTHNWKESLGACLASLFAQRDRRFEIVEADDGSRSDTADLVRRMARDSPVPLKYCYHENLGFRAGAIRNRGIQRCAGDYIVFVDGDCLTFPHFIRRHRRLARAGRFVAGNRILLSQPLTRAVLEGAAPLTGASRLRFLRHRLRKDVNRVTPLLHVPFDFWRTWSPRSWKMAMCCNLGAWKRDLVAVNGFDERFVGWGFEDSDLVVRLIHSGITRIDGRFALPVLHLWHAPQQRDGADANFSRLCERLRQGSIQAERGLAQLEAGGDQPAAASRRAADSMDESHLV